MQANDIEQSCHFLRKKFNRGESQSPKINKNGEHIATAIEVENRAEIILMRYNHCQYNTTKPHKHINSFRCEAKHETPSTFKLFQYYSACLRSSVCIFIRLNYSPRCIPTYYKLKQKQINNPQNEKKSIKSKNKINCTS